MKNKKQYLYYLPLCLLVVLFIYIQVTADLALVITSYSIHYTKLYEFYYFNRLISIHFFELMFKIHKIGKIKAATNVSCSLKWYSKNEAGQGPLYP